MTWWKHGGLQPYVKPVSTTVDTTPADGDCLYCGGHGCQACDARESDGHQNLNTYDDGHTSTLAASAREMAEGARRVSDRIRRDRALSEARVRDSEQRLRTTVSAYPVGITEFPDPGLIDALDRARTAAEIVAAVPPGLSVTDTGRY